jgi:iron complex transport system ATP-binding protein
MKPKPFLIVENLSIGFRENNTEMVLASGMNFSLNPGELVCLIGPNGAGKSTLIRTLAGLQPSLDGSITLLNRPIASYSSRQIAQLVSLVLTTPVQVINMTAFDIVALGRHPFTNWLGHITNQDKKIVTQSIKAVGAEQFTHREITHLSDGERQKIMVARALAQQPKVMILDEPTAFLDFPNRVEILAMLHRLANKSDQAVLLSTHDLNLAISIADKMMIMDDMGTLSVGAPEDLIIDGSFEKAFNPAGTLNFNAFNGTFSLQHKNGLYFSVKAETELLEVWTTKAIERLGFQVNPTAEILIQATTKNDTPVWLLTIDNHEQRFESIYALLQYLRIIDDQ